MPYRTINVPNSPTEIIAVLGNTLDAYTLANNDLVNSVFICHRKVFNVTDSDVVQIPALGAAPLATRESTYARTSQASPVQCLLIPGTGGWVAAPSQIQASLNALGLAKDSSVNAPSYGPSTSALQSSGIAAVNSPAYGPSTAANQGTLITGQTNQNTAIPNNIATTGVPLIGQSVGLINTSGNVAAAGSVDLGTFSTTNISYSAFCTLVDNAAGTAQRTVGIQFTFKDSVTGQIVDQALFEPMPAGSGQAARQLVFRGPMSANQVNVQIINHDTAQVAYVFRMVESSHVYTHDHKYLSLNNPPASSQTLSTDDIQAGLVIDTSPTIASGATITRQMTCYNGRVGIHIASPSSLAGVFSIASNDHNATNDGTVWGEVMTPPPTHEYHEAILPRSHCILSIKNNGASSGGFPCTIVILDN